MPSAAVYDAGVSPWSSLDAVSTATGAVHAVRMTSQVSQRITAYNGTPVMSRAVPSAVIRCAL